MLAKLSLLLVLLLGAVPPVQAINFNAFWLHRVSGGGERDTRTEFQQRYNLGVGPQLNWQPTHAFSASANISYTQAQRDTGDGLEKSERVSPSTRLNLTNDIFTASLAGSASRGRRDSEWGDVSRSWGATLASAWDIPLWPSLGLNYSEQPSSVDSSSDLFASPDRLQRTGSAAVDWDLLLADLSYHYTRTRDEDRVSGNSSESNSHFFRGETSGRLLFDRVNYRFSQQYQETRLEGLTFGEWNLAGTRFAKQMDGSGINPDDPEDTGGSDPEVFGYQDPARGLPLDVAPLNRIHVMFSEDTGFPQQIDLVRLVFDESGVPQVPLDWQLYQRSSDLDPWQGVGLVTGQFDLDGRLEIPVDLLTRQVLLVSATSAGVPLTLQAVNLYALFDEGDDALTASSSINTSWLTNAGLNLKLTRTISASLNMTLEQRENESLNQFSFLAEDESRTRGDAERLSLSGRLQWRPLDWLSTSLGVSDTEETATATNVTLSGGQSTEEDRASRTYSWSLLTRPLETMNVTFGVTRNESDAEDSSRENTGSGWQYSLSTTAHIYPDLNAALFLTYAERESETGIDDTTSLTDSTSYAARLNLDARLTGTLSADTSLNYRRSEVSRSVHESEADMELTTQSEDETETASVTLNMNYRPSTYLSLRAFYTTYFLDSTQADNFGARLTMAFLRTNRSSLTLNYSFTYDEQTTNSVNLSGSWDISDRMSLRSRATYVMAQTDFYSVETSLNFRL